MRLYYTVHTVMYAPSKYIDTAKALAEPRVFAKDSE